MLNFERKHFLAFLELNSWWQILSWLEMWLGTVNNFVVLFLNIRVFEDECRVKWAESKKSKAKAEWNESEKGW